MLEGIMSYIDIIPYSRKRVPHSFMLSALSNLKCFIFLNLCKLVKRQKFNGTSFFFCFGITATSFVLNMNGAFNLFRKDWVLNLVLLLGSYWKRGDYLGWSKNAKDSDSSLEVLLIRRCKKRRCTWVIHLCFSKLSWRARGWKDLVLVEVG